MKPIGFGQDRVDSGADRSSLDRAACLPECICHSTVIAQNCRLPCDGNVGCFTDPERSVSYPLKATEKLIGQLNPDTVAFEPAKMIIPDSLRKPGQVLDIDEYNVVLKNED